MAAASGATAAPAPLAHVTGRTIVLDPGHNGGNRFHAREIGRLVDAGTLRKPCDTVGAQTAAGYPEWAFTLDVAQRLARILRRAGANVVLTRTGSLLDRLEGRYYLPLALVFTLVLLLAVTR